jgi:hypothetical protein
MQISREERLEGIAVGRRLAAFDAALRSRGLLYVSGLPAGYEAGPDRPHRFTIYRETNGSPFLNLVFSIAEADAESAIIAALGRIALLPDDGVTR